MAKCILGNHMPKVLKLNIDKLLNIIIVFCITIWTIGGSLYYMLDIKSVLLMIVVYAFCFFVLICKNHITVNKIFILFIMQTMFLLFKNEDLRRGIYYISNPIIYLSILALIYILKDLNYQDILKKYFKFIKIGYFIYASFTIIYFFSKPLFMVINYSLFPFAIDRMTEQYMKGCMCGLTNHYSTNGMLLAVGTILFGCESLFVQKINKKKLVLFIYMVIALLLTGKRAHVMFTIISLLIVAYFYMSNNKNKRFINFLKIFRNNKILHSLLCNLHYERKYNTIY